MRRILGILGAVALAGGAALAQGGATTASSTDNQFLQKAYNINLGEVRLGELAQQRGQSQTVKDLGRRMVGDHQLALDQLRRAAQQDGLTLPNELDPQTKQAYERLSQLSGQSFDLAYLEHMKSGHDKAIQAFQNEANNGQATNLRNYAKKTLPALHAHADVVQQDQQQLMQQQQQQPQPSSTQPGTSPSGTSPSGLGNPPATTTPGATGNPPGSIEVHPTQQPAQPAPPM